MFFSKTDTHRLLLNDILGRYVNCAFDNPGKPNESIHLVLSGKYPDKLKRYANFNVFSKH